MKTPARAVFILVAGALGAGSVMAADAPASKAPPVQTTANVALTAAPGSQVKGDLTLASQGTGLTIRGEVSGLTPRQEHGFHVHEVGECAPPDFKSAGEHFNPTMDPHGGPKAKARHLGDIPNIKADESGRARIDVTVPGLSLEDRDGAPTAVLGKALVIHAMKDDYKTQPSGGSGDRIACGVIR